MTNENVRWMRNRHGMKIAIYTTEPQGDVVGTVIMAHGLSSCSNRALFKETASTFIDAGFQVVRYDATHSLGASDGDPQYCTMTSLAEDFEDVKKNIARRGKLILLGHSLGSMAAGLNAESADALILISSVTDGKKSFEYSWTPDQLDEWEAAGYVERGRGDGYHRVRYSHYHDRCGYTLLGTYFTLRMDKPVLFISGTEDADRPGTDDLEQMIQNTHGHASRVTRLDLEGVGHSIREPEHLAQVNDAIAAFIKQLLLLTRQSKPALGN